MNNIMDFSLERNPWGHLVAIDAQGQRFEGVVPVRAFPLQAPDEGIAIVCRDGSELFWIDQLSSMPDPTQHLIREELALRDWVPAIQDILSVTSYATPCTWQVQTDRGKTHFVLRAEEDIRRLGSGNALLLSDASGIHYRIADRQALSPSSKKILDRFL